MINYVKGDATQPQGDGLKFIAHVCNDAGKWGAGFVMALSARSKEPQRAYINWYKLRTYARYAPHYYKPFRLGEIQLAAYVTNPITPQTLVVNMIAQEGVEWKAVPRWADDPYGQQDFEPPISYLYLATCLHKLRKLALFHNASVHMPRIGCGLAGGKWEIVEPLVEHILAEQGVPVTVYDL